MTPLVFAVDDTTERCRRLCAILEMAGYTVQVFAASQLLRSLSQETPALMFIPLNLPDCNGVDLCRMVQQVSAPRPRIILVADNWEEAFHAMSAQAADDCISEPFTPEELLSRLEAVLCRAAASSDQEAEIVINSSAMQLKVRGTEVPTTTLEFRLIEYMARHRGKVFTRDALLDAVWGDQQFVTPRTVDACVGRIRRKIEHDRTTPTYLRTIRGIGYKLDAATSWESLSSEFCHCASCSMSRTGSKAKSTAARRVSA